MKSKEGERGRESRGREGGGEEKGTMKGCVMAVGGWTPLVKITCVLSTHRYLPPFCNLTYKRPFIYSFIMNSYTIKNKKKNSITKE